MSLKAAFMLPHPPLIVSEIGKGREEDIIKTKTSYEKVTEEITVKLPVTGDNNTLLIVLGILVVAIIVVSIRIKSLKKENK